VKADYVVTGGGTVYLITPTNPEAKANLLSGVSSESRW
jgi:hypothetical protein